MQIILSCDLQTHISNDYFWDLLIYEIFFILYLLVKYCFIFNLTQNHHLFLLFIIYNLLLDEGLSNTSTHLCSVKLSNINNNFIRLFISSHPSFRRIIIIWVFYCDSSYKYIVYYSEALMFIFCNDKDISWTLNLYVCNSHYIHSE